MIEIELASVVSMGSFVLGMAVMGFIGWIDEREKKKREHKTKETRGTEYVPRYNLNLPWKRR